MKIYDETTKFDGESSVVALGNFDGLHIAHMQIIYDSIEYAKEHNILCGVLLFDRHSKNIIKNDNIELIMTIEEKIEILKNAGVDFVYIKRFDDEFMKNTPDEFVKILLDDLHIKAVCVGYDYRFGYKASGDIDLLKQLGNKFNFKVSVTDAVKVNDTVVASSYIRQLISDGDIDKANNLLGRYFCVSGVVVMGLQNGRKMGIPTANIDTHENMVLPKYGVYAGYTVVKNNRYKCVINVGQNPTFDAKKVTVESHILDFDDDIYGEIIKIEFVKYLREDKKFSSIDELKKQIHNDIDMANHI